MLEALSILEAQDILMLPVLKNLGKLYTKNGRLVIYFVAPARAPCYFIKIHGRPVPF